MEEYDSDQIYFFCKDLRDDYRKTCGKLDYTEWVKHLFLLSDFRVVLAQAIYQENKKHINTNELTEKQDRRYLLGWFLQVIHNPDVVYKTQLKQAEVVGALLLKEKMSNKNYPTNELTQEWIVTSFVQMLLQQTKFTLLELHENEKEWLTREQEQKNILELREELLVTDANFRFGLFTVVDAKLRLDIVNKKVAEKPANLWNQSGEYIRYNFLRWLSYIYEKEKDQICYQEKEKYLVHTMVKDGCKSQGRVVNAFERLCPLLKEKKQEKLKDCTFGGCGFYKDCSLAGKDSNLGIKKKRILINKVMKRYLDKIFDDQGGEVSIDGAFI